MHIQRHGRQLLRVVVGVRNSEFISEIHCSVYRKAGEVCIVQEPKCRNGVWVNGVLLGPYQR